MSSRSVVWALAILAVVIVVVPLLGMAGMMTCCSGMMNMGGSSMMGMSALGIFWMVLAAAIIVAPIVLLFRASKT